MAFARALRSDERDNARRPIGPPLDQRKCRSVGWTFKQVLARKAFAMTECKRKLARCRHQGSPCPRYMVLSRYRRSMKRTSTATAADSGIATINPTKPNR